MTTARLELRGIRKAFPGTLANEDVSLSIAPGEIHALLGENGAGKSTLVKILYGVLKADAGNILWNGAPVSIHSPREARALGVGMVFQHFSLFEALTVAENIELGMDDPGDRRALEGKISEVGERYGLPLDPRRHVYTLSAGEKQRIEIIRALLQDPQLLVMDEPTSVLTPQEAESLLQTLKRLAGEGRSVLYISHKLEEIAAFCHQATVLRGGKVVATCDPQQESAGSMAEMMIGRRVSPPHWEGHGDDAKERLVLNGLSADAPDQFGTSLKNVSLTVHAGEIVGIAGVAGNGQSELLSLLSGEQMAPRDDMVVMDGTPVGNWRPNERRRVAAGFVPEERLGHAAVPGMSLTENALLTGFQRQRMTVASFILGGAAGRFAKKVCDVFAVKHAGVHHMASSLSGGNLQKFVIGREIEQNPGILIALQPTWGVDTGAASAIQQALINLASNGAAVLVISQDLDELLAICARIAVLYHGQLSEAHPASALTVEQIGLLMAGHSEAAAGTPARTPEAAH